MADHDYEQTDKKPRSLDEFRTSGLLWLVNRTVFHPRGYALSIHYDSDPRTNPDAQATGWSLLGDGTEPWRYAFPDDDPPEDEIFAKIKELMP